MKCVNPFRIIAPTYFSAFQYSAATDLPQFTLRQAQYLKFKLCNGIRTQNHLVRKRTLNNHLAKTCQFG